MRRLDDASWRYINAAKSHVGFKQRLRRYAEMVKTEHRGDSDGASVAAVDAALVAACLRNHVDN